MTRLLLVVLPLLSASLASACGNPVQAACEQKCYAQRSNEPRDFDDCIRRCSKK